VIEGEGGIMDLDLELGLCVFYMRDDPTAVLPTTYLTLPVICIAPRSCGPLRHHSNRSTRRIASKLDTRGGVWCLLLSRHFAIRSVYLAAARRGGRIHSACKAHHAYDRGRDCSAS
jgi:hypothetical protein